MEKKFRPFDKVLVRYTRGMWVCDLYSHYCESEKLHYAMVNGKRLDDNILPFVGNEHLVGTSDDPDEEVKLEEGECCVFFDDLESFEKIKDLIVDIFSCRDMTEDAFWQDGEPNLWKFCIRFKDFDPSNMEETKKHILCVKNGRIIRYKD